MPAYARIAVNINPISGLFDYHIPPELEEHIRPGSLVTVPFGAQTVQGLVVALVDTPEVPETKPVYELLDEIPALTDWQLRLAAWMQQTFLAPQAETLDLMLPPGLAQQADRLFEPAENPPPLEQLGLIQARVYEKIRASKGLRGRQLEKAFPRIKVREIARALTARGYLVSHPILLPPAVRPKYVRTAQLILPPERVREVWDSLARAGSDALSARQQALEFLINEPEAVDVAWVYASAPGCTLADLQALEKAGLIRLSESEVWRDPLARLEFVPASAPRLTASQLKVWEAIRANLQAAPPKPMLLHGVTGSGKTELYLRAVEETLKQGRQAVILVPEIALTPQTVRRFAVRFPGQIGLVHSRLSPGERYDTWRRARSGKLPVIIGPRSALFTPLPDPGLFVVDECHDPGYYQDDFPPAYDAVETALAAGQICGAGVILGSATPTVSQFFRAQRGKWVILDLPRRILAHRAAVQQQLSELGQPAGQTDGEGDSASLPLPPVELIDMRQELKAGNTSIFSRKLQDALRQTLAAGQQAILYLNRRGTATYVFCRSCGFHLLCPRCDVPLVFHASRGNLLCHHCGYERELPKICPVCKSSAIRQFGTGTEKVQAEVEKLLPEARVLRWDAESTRQKNAHEIILGHFSAHRADILVGTQMLAKGLDLPLVTLVGVVLADVGLNLPDYRAGERTFQLLTQVAGRAGRSPLGGKVILQTYNPSHPVLLHAAAHDYEGFKHQELEARQRIGYPPYSHILRLEFRALSDQQAREAAEKAGVLIRSWLESGEHRQTEMIGPLPCFFHREAGFYRWQILLRGPDPARVVRGRQVPDARLAVDPPDLL